MGYFTWKLELVSNILWVIVGNRVRISKHKNTFAKAYGSNWSEEAFISKIKNTVPWTYVSSDLNGEEIAGTFHEKELLKTDQQESRIEKVIKRKANELFVKWKGYDNSLKSWIDKNDVIQKWVNTFPNQVNLLEEMWKLN